VLHVVESAEESLRKMNSKIVESDIAGFLAKYSPAIAAQLRDARAKLRTLFPRGFELIYDNYNTLAFGFSTTARASDALVSIAGYPKWITLFFLRGASLVDAKGLLQGQGTRVRSIRLAGADDLDKREIQALIAQAVRPFKAAFLAAPPFTTIVKSVSAKQRPRRPSPTSRPAARPKRLKSSSVKK
jgi:hypothetical protein